MTLTQGLIVPRYFSVNAPYLRRLAWASSLFALLADISMIYFGGALKGKQKLTGRLGDILSHLYLATAVMDYYNRLDQHKQALVPVVKWALAHCFYNVQLALTGYFNNFWLFKFTLAPLFRLFPIGKAPSDALGKQVAQLIQTDIAVRDFFTDAVYVPENAVDGIAKYDDAYLKIMAAQPAISLIKRAQKQRALPKGSVMAVLDQSLQHNVITSADAELIKQAETARLDAIQVDAFTNDEYFGTV